MNLTPEEKAHILLSSVEGIGGSAIARLTEAYPSFEAVLADAEAAAIRAKLPEKAAAELVKVARPAYGEAFFEKLYRLSVTPVSTLSPLFPELLREIPRAPQVLYCMGDLSLLSARRTCAMVGTRTPTPAGKKLARTLARDLAKAGVTIVSGMARGIDGASHAGALEAGGKTIAVLGCGVNVCYPEENRELYESILEKGLVISEYLPSVPALSFRFPVRNRIVSGLSEAVVVVEAGARSGSAITVRHAQDQGRDVFAVPGQVGSASSVLTNRLISEGAGLVTCADDLLTAMHWRPRGKKAPEPEKKAPEARKYTSDERQIVDLLVMGPKSKDELYDLTEFSMTELSRILTDLTFSGAVTSLNRNIYCLTEDDQ